MTTEEMQALADRYNERFGNLDEICYPEIVFDPKFLQLLEQALERNSAITVDEMERVFPDAGWEEVRRKP